VPKLAGQKTAYLAHALADYAHRRRPSGIMELMAVPLERQAQEAFATYYGGLRATPTAPPGVDPARIERGREIATRGLPDKGVPSCLSCHSTRTAATFPLLEGQYAPYLAQQLHGFKDGRRAGTAQGAIMTAIARRLNVEQIDDVSAYFETLTAASQTANGANR
jgi:cytochrome c553